MQKDLAARYGVSTSLIWRLQNDPNTYAHLGTPVLADGESSDKRAP